MVTYLRIKDINKTVLCKAFFWGVHFHQREYLPNKVTVTNDIQNYRQIQKKVANHVERTDKLTS